MSAMIYLDYAASTPLDAAVAKRMREIEEQCFANPASNHIAGRQSAAVIDRAAQQLAALLGTDPTSFLWTSGATESNNLAITGVAKQRAHRGRHLVTMHSEHKAVVDVFRALEKQGFEVTWLNGDSEGYLSTEQLLGALRDDTQLVSIMHINNEIGTRQDIAALGSICRERGITFHVDGAQAAGKVAVDLSSLPVDLYSLTAHKFYGPKGIGALYVADNVVLEPLLFGGGQQRRLRPGTLPVALIAGLGEAAAVAATRLEDDQRKTGELKTQLWLGLQAIEGVTVNGPAVDAYPGILNVSVSDIEGESLMLALEPLCVASGSACNSRSKEPSYVLRSLGRSDAEAESAIRFSLGRATTEDEIQFAIAHYRQAVEKLRHLSPKQRNVA
jgi:cysteine desulfurase